MREASGIKLRLKWLMLKFWKKTKNKKNKINKKGSLWL